MAMPPQAWAWHPAPGKSGGQDIAAITKRKIIHAPKSVAATIKNGRFRRGGLAGGEAFVSEEAAASSTAGREPSDDAPASARFLRLDMPSRAAPAVTPAA
jgi:hypothetical protein